MRICKWCIGMRMDVLCVSQVHFGPLAHRVCWTTVVDGAGG